MENIKTWILCVCVVSIASSIISVLLPDGSVSATVKNVLRLFTLLAVLTPLYGFSDWTTVVPQVKTFDMSEYETINIADLQNSLSADAENEIERQIENIVSQYFCNEYEIFVDTDILSGQCINIKRIAVIFNEPVDDEESLKNDLVCFYPACEISFYREDINFED